MTGLDSIRKLEKTLRSKGKYDVADWYRQYGDALENYSWGMTDCCVPVYIKNYYDLVGTNDK